MTRTEMLCRDWPFWPFSSTVNGAPGGNRWRRTRPIPPKEMSKTLPGQPAFRRTPESWHDASNVLAYRTQARRSIGEAREILLPSRGLPLRIPFSPGVVTSNYRPGQRMSQSTKSISEIRSSNRECRELPRKYLMLRFFDSGLFPMDFPK